MAGDPVLAVFDTATGAVFAALALQLELAALGRPTLEGSAGCSFGSASIHAAVRGKVCATFTDQGEPTVKNVAHPVRAD
jgi:adenylate cyclase